MSQSQPFLPTNRAFLVQFRTHSMVASPSYAGRVEHVVSGEGTRFQSLDGGPGEEPARGTDGGWFGQLNQAALAGRREQPSIRPHRSKRPHPELGMTLHVVTHAMEGVL